MLDRCKRYVLVMVILANVLSVSACIRTNFENIEPKSRLATLSMLPEQKILFHVEIADTPKKRAQGLMHRTHLPEKYGMLFVFEHSGRHSFWMKNTLISLDLIYLDNNFLIVDIISNAPPKSSKIITSKTDYNYVFEVSAGTAKKLNINIGDRFILSKPYLH